MKNVLIALAVIAVVAGVGIYFLPNHYEINNSIEIDRPATEVYAVVADFNTWGKWDPFAEKEPTAKREVAGTAATPGHKLSWAGKELGVGSMTIAYVTANQSIVTNDSFVKPMASTSRDWWTIEAEGSKTKVTWTTKGGLKYPAGRLFGLAVNKMLGGAEKHGLDNLKKYVEGLPAAPSAPSDSTATVAK